MRNFFKIFSLTLLIFALSFSTSYAEQKIFESQGEYILSKYDSLKVGEERARNDALRNAAEMAGIYIKSYTEITNGSLTEDEIKVIATSILRIIDEKIEHVPTNEYVKIVVTLKVAVNTDDISEFDK